MSVTSKFSLSFDGTELGSPFIGGKRQSVQNTTNFLRSLLAGTKSGTLTESKNEVAATGAITLTGATTSCTATINGVQTADCIGADDNATATLLVTDINAETDDLVEKQVTAARTLTAATGYFTLAGATGSLTVAVGGTNVSFTAVADNVVDSRTLAAAINANGTVAAKVVAVSDGVDKVNLTAVQSETWGGRLGNAIALTGTTGVTRSAATLTGGLTKVTLTSINPGFAGNTTTFLAAAGGGTIAPTSATRLTGGTATQTSYAFPG